MKTAKPTPTADQLAALAAYAEKHGRTWKHSLRLAWFNGTDANEPAGCFLRQVRNELGPRWLNAFRLENRA